MSRSVYIAILSVAFLSIALLFANIESSYAEKPDAAKKVTDKVKDTVNNAASTVGKGNDNKASGSESAKGNNPSADKGNDKQEKGSEKSHGNDNKASGNEGKNNENKPHDNKIKGKDNRGKNLPPADRITNDPSVRGKGIVYDFTKPVIQEIVRIKNLTCAKLSDNSGIYAAFMGSKSLELYSGSYNWYCANGPMADITVIDLAGNEISKSFSTKNVVQEKQSDDEQKSQPFNFRFKNMDTSLFKKLYH